MLPLFVDQLFFPEQFFCLVRKGRFCRGSVACCCGCQQFPDIRFFCLLFCCCCLVMFCLGSSEFFVFCLFLSLFSYVFVFEEKENMVRPAEYLLCGGVAVIDNNVVVGTLLWIVL